MPAPDTDLIESGVLDSLQQVQLLLHVEEHIGTRILARVIMPRTAMAA